MFSSLTRFSPNDSILEAPLAILLPFTLRYSSGFTIFHLEMEACL